MVDEICRETLQDKVYNSIKESIVKNVLEPGEKISIDSLAKAMEVSPTPVREALAKLSAQGLIETSQNKKAKVASITEEDVKQAYEVRKLLEPYATSQAAREVSKNVALRDKFTDLREKSLDVRKKISEKGLTSDIYDKYLEVDIHLDELVKMALGNTLLEMVLRQMGDHSIRIRSCAEACCEDELPDIALENTVEHLKIINALLNENGEEIKDLVLTHLNNAESRTLNALEAT